MDKEVKDIVPGLLNDIEKSFKNNTKNSKKLKDKLLKIKNKSANHLDSNDFAQEVGEILSKSLRENITKEVLPNGKMYYNIADRVVNPNVKKNYDLINTYAKEVQKNLNKDANISINSVDAGYNQDRVDGIIEDVLKQDDYNNMLDHLSANVENFSRAIVDDFVRKNADMQYKAGLSPVIERKMHGGACPYCIQLAGTYDYEEAKRLAETGSNNNPFSRHRHCKCTVIFNPKNGKKRQVVHSADKHKALDERRDRIDLANKIVDNRLSNITRAKAMELGYNPLPDEKVVNVLRKDAKKWIQTLSDDEIKAIRKYTYNGKDKDGLRLFEKNNGFLDGRYKSFNEKEKEIILRNTININNGLLKNKLKHDIIVYRKDYYPKLLEGSNKKFLSTSVTKKGVIKGSPNVAIIVPKETRGSYVELLSEYKKQREYLLNKDAHLEKLFDNNGNYIYIARNYENKR